MHDLIGRLGQGGARKIFNSYKNIFDKTMREHGQILSDSEGKLLISSRGSISICIVADNNDKTAKERQEAGILALLDRVGAEFRKANNEGYTIAVSTLAITSPRNAASVRELYFALPDVTLPVSKTSTYGHGLVEATAYEAMNTVKTTRGIEKAVGFAKELEDLEVAEEVRQYREEILTGLGVAPVTGEEILYVQANRRIPENDIAIYEKSLKVISGLLGRKAPQNKDEAINIYDAYLLWAFDRNLGNVAIAPQSVFDLYSLSLESLVEIYNNAEYVFSADSDVLAAIKKATAYKILALPKDAGNYEKLMYAWERGFINDKEASGWIALAENLDLPIVKVVSAALAKDRENVFKDFAVIIREPRIINIAGQARGGKTTAAKALAAAHGYTYFDSGLVYRAYAWKILQEVNADRLDEKNMEKSLPTLLGKIKVDFRNGYVYVDGHVLDADMLHKDKSVEEMNTRLRRIPEFRKMTLERERAVRSQLARRGVIVLAGRGYAPDAAANIFLKASINKRISNARSSGETGTDAEIQKILEERDLNDRANEALHDYPGMFTVIDATTTNPEEMVRVIGAEVKAQKDRRVALAT
jgi:cytidylate kinase